jgi:hypothetical protein
MLKKAQIFYYIKKIFFTIHEFESINCHQFYFPHKKSFLRIKMSSFSLLVWVGSFLQNIIDGRSLVTLNRLTNLAERRLVHNLLLNCMLLGFFYILDQNFLRATSTFLITERLVEIRGASFGFRSREPGTLKWVPFLGTRSPQVGSVPGNPEPSSGFRSWELGTLEWVPFPGTRNPRVGFVPGNPEPSSGFRSRERNAKERER